MPQFTLKLFFGRQVPADMQGGARVRFDALDSEAAVSLAQRFLSERLEKNHAEDFDRAELCGSDGAVLWEKYPDAYRRKPK